jgi:hypothetical protein
VLQLFHGLYLARSFGRRPNGRPKLW